MQGVVLDLSLDPPAVSEHRCEARVAFLKQS
jgi:hypothetical protein